MSTAENFDGTDYLRDVHGITAEPVKAHVVKLADVQAQHLEWLWEGRLPIGKMVMLDGAPGVAKSTIWVDIAARLSNADGMPDGSPGWHEPAHTVVLAAEDGIGDTLRPRFDAAGGDPNFVHVVEYVPREQGLGFGQSPDVVAHLDQIVEAIKDVGARLLVIDVLMAHIGTATNTYRDQEVRTALAPLIAAAETEGFCILALRHFRKGSTNAIESGGGSIGLIGAARVGLTAGFDPEDEELPEHEKRRVLAVSKCNIARKAASLSYRVEDVVRVDATEDNETVGRIEWLGASERTADDLTDRQNAETERTDKVVFLTELLTDGPVPAKDVEDAARIFGWTLKALRPTLKRLGGEVAREGFGSEGVWVWRMDAAPKMPIGDLDAHPEKRASMASMGTYASGSSPKMPIGDLDAHPEKRASMASMGTYDTDPICDHCAGSIGVRDWLPYCSSRCQGAGGGR